MNKELEKKFDEEFYEGENNSVFCKKHKIFATPYEIKSFINTHFIAKEDELTGLPQGEWLLYGKRHGYADNLYTKADLLDILDKLPYGNEWSEAERYGAIQRVKEEIRERINGNEKESTN